MLPSGVGGALLLLTLIPGWLYLRLQERLRPPSGATGLGELLEVVAVGLATTGTSATLAVVVPHRWAPFLLDLEAWAAKDSYLVDHLRVAVGTVAIILGLALLISYGLYQLQRLRLPNEFRAQGSVWVHALGARPARTVPWVGLQLTDGRLVEGVLHSFSLDGGNDGRDIALASPIRITERPGTPAKRLKHLDRVIVPDRSIAHIAVAHVPER